MTEQISQQSGNLIQWQDTEAAILIEPFSAQIALTQESDQILIDVYAVDELIKNLKKAQKIAKQKAI